MWSQRCFAQLPALQLLLDLSHYRVSLLQLRQWAEDDFGWFLARFVTYQQKNRKGYLKRTATQEHNPLSMGFSGTPKDMGPPYGKRDPYYKESLKIWLHLIHLSIHLSIYQPIYQPIWLNLNLLPCIHLSSHLSTRLEDSAFDELPGGGAAPLTSPGSMLLWVWTKHRGCRYPPKMDGENNGGKPY